MPQPEQCLTGFTNDGTRGHNKIGSLAPTNTAHSNKDRDKGKDMADRNNKAVRSLELPVADTPARADSYRKRFSTESGPRESTSGPSETRESG